MLVATLVGFAAAATFAQSVVNLGMVGVKSTHGRYLQAHDDDGELHASNEHRNQEETWFLVEINRDQHIYALQNWRNGKFMSKRTNGCAPAVSTTLGPAEQWRLVSGGAHGVVNAIAFRSVADGTFVRANGPGEDTSCGGEVAARDGHNPPVNNSQWPGWWVLERATTPSPGQDPWNTVGGVFQGLVANITPADIVAVLSVLAAL